MSFYQNLNYAIVQVAHNFGAVAVVGGSLAALKFRGEVARSELARIVLAGWVTQGVSGAGLFLPSVSGHRRNCSGCAGNKNILCKSWIRVDDNISVSE